MQTQFIGLDLAWSPRNNSAGVALQGEGPCARWVAHCERLGSDEDIVAFVGEASGEGPALVAIDAPLIVPNEEGARPVDREITRLYGRYGAGCYPANRQRIGGGIRGEKIVAALERYGFIQDPHIQRLCTTRCVFEVYPHPATITLFHLDRTLQYKPRPHRTLESRRGELARLRELLRGLDSRVPAALMDKQVMNRAMESLAGSALKRYEDLLDAALCAYIAYYAWYWGPAGYQVYGDTTCGYILVPRALFLDQSPKSEYSMAVHGGG